MKNLKYLKTFALLLFCSIILTAGNFDTDSVAAQPIAAPVQTLAETAKDSVSPLNVVNNPTSFLNKKITMIARFDKFSTLGLDYKPALRSSDNYISFLIKRDDTVHDIPLSEMKLFLKRDLAEKFLELKTNDKIQITGTVFSDALGDAWIDAEALTVIQKAPEKDGVK